MKDILDSKDIYRIDLASTEIRKYIKDIDWGFKDSFTGNPQLTFEYYRDILIEEYFKSYNEKSNRLLFSFFILYQF